MGTYVCTFVTAYIHTYRYTTSLGIHLQHDLQLYGLVSPTKRGKS